MSTENNHYYQLLRNSEYYPIMGFAFTTHWDDDQTTGLIYYLCAECGDHKIGECSVIYSMDATELEGAVCEDCRKVFVYGEWQWMFPVIRMGNEKLYSSIYHRIISTTLKVLKLTCSNPSCGELSSYPDSIESIPYNSSRLDDDIQAMQDIAEAAMIDGWKIWLKPRTKPGMVYIPELMPLPEELPVCPSCAQSLRVSGSDIIG